MTLKPGFEGGYVNFLNIIKNIKFKSSNPNLYPPLIKILTVGNFTRPISIARPILSLLEHDDKIKEFLIKKDSSLSLKETLSIIANLNKLPLLYTLMRLCPLPDLKFETLFVAMRKTLLKNIDKMEATPELINFLSTLSINCFINEFIFIESKEETYLIDELQTKILKKFEQSEQPETIKILCLASYRPLHQYEWCQNIECFNDLKEVSARLIEEPLAEKLIAKGIPQLGRISDDISLMVRKQYEENPYPRWVKLGIPLKSKPIATVCDELKLKLYSDKIKDVSAPTILIAGCGSGQQSIETAATFSNCHVTAVDLSMTSLAYARRKSNELSFANLDYLQADILHLHQIKKEFDIIESVGVLHHMDEPMTGWKVLTDILKPGGLMRIGLYSELGRKEIVKARREIASLEIGTSANEIRKFQRINNFC
jgi:SAM-dependent methyltransferase